MKLHLCTGVTTLWSWSKEMKLHLCTGVTTLWSWSKEMKLIIYALELPLFGADPKRWNSSFMHWSYHSLELIQRDETHHSCTGVTTLWSWSREMKLITYALELPLFEAILSSLLKLHFFPASPSSPSLITLDTLPVWWPSNGPMQSDPCCCMHNWWTVMGAKAYTLSYAPMSIIQVWPASMTTNFVKALSKLLGHTGTTSYYEEKIPKIPIFITTLCTIKTSIWQQPWLFNPGVK